MRYVGVLYATGAELTRGVPQGGDLRPTIFLGSSCVLVAASARLWGRKRARRVPTVRAGLPTRATMPACSGGFRANRLWWVVCDSSARAFDGPAVRSPTPGRCFSGSLSRENRWVSGWSCRPCPRGTGRPPFQELFLRGYITIFRGALS